MFQVFNALKLLRHLRRVRYQHERHIFLAARVADQIDHLLLMPGVDICRRFIGQEQFRFVGQGSRTATRCCSPTESCDGLCERRFPRPTRSNKCRARSGCTLPLANDIPKSTFSSAENAGSRLNV